MTGVRRLAGLVPVALLAAGPVVAAVCEGMCSPAVRGLTAAGTPLRRARLWLRHAPAQNHLEGPDMVCLFTTTNAMKSRRPTGPTHGPPARGVYPIHSPIVLRI